MRQGATFALVPLCFGIMLSPALAGSWALPDESRGARVAPMLLLSRPEVQEDLHLTADQVVEVEKAIDELHQKAAALKGKTGEAAVAGRKAVDEGQKLWLENHLAPDQVDRLAQIDLRWEGPAAMLTRHTVAETMALSDEQKVGLGHAIEGRKKHLAKTKDLPATEEVFTNKVMALLTEGQKRRWDRMLGRPLAEKTASAVIHR